MPRSRAGAVLALCLLGALPGFAPPARAQNGALNNRLGGFGPPPGHFDNRLNGSGARTGGPVAGDAPAPATAPVTGAVQDQVRPDTGARPPQAWRGPRLPPPR